MSLTVPMGSAEQCSARPRPPACRWRVLGETGGAALTLADSGTISVADLKAAHEAFFPDLMSAGS